MKGVRWVLLLFVHVVATTHPRSVNLALETTFEFNEKKDMSFIKDMRRFFDKVETNVEKKLILRDRPESYRFTDFVQELITVLVSYDDTDFRSVFKELYHVINNQRKGGAELNDIMSTALRPTLLEAIRRSTETPTRLLKERLKRLSSLLSKTDKSHASFVNFLNLLYKGKSPMTLKRIIRGFRLLRKRPNPDVQLRRLVRNAVEYLVYEHYAGLDTSVKRDVGKWLRAVIKKEGNFAYRQTLKPKTTRTLPLTRLRHTFITLYPEPIDFKAMRYQTERTPVTGWKRVTLKSQGRFMLLKGQRRSYGNRSEETEESSWSSLEIAEKKSPTSVYRQVSQRKTDFTKPHNLEYSLRREINSSLPSLAKDTSLNESVSQIYLNRLRQLEDQLNAMKKELKARMSLPPVTEVQTEIEYDNLVQELKESLENSTKNETDVEKKVNETDKPQTRFRTSIGNKSLVLGDSQLSNEIKEFLKKKPEILNVSLNKDTSDVPKITDTVTDTTTESDFIVRSRIETDSKTTTVIGNETVKITETTNNTPNITTTTTNMENTNNETTTVEVTTNTTSRNEYMNDTLIL